MPDDIRDEGISELKIEADVEKVYLHQKGWLTSESPEVNFEDTCKLALTHEIVHLLDYDSRPCIQDINYRNDFCRRDFIFKVILFLL